MIEFKNVGVSYSADTPVFSNVNFTINKGDFVAFVGTNGAGKSTAMRLMNGLLKPTQGEVLVDEVATTKLKTSELARKIGFLFQNPDRQICCRTVREELEFSFKAQGKLTDEAHERINAVIDLFGFDEKAEPYLLNRGTRQLLALASIIVVEPEVIILDEPTTGLDYRECMKVMEAIVSLHEKGKTIVMVCHDMELVADFAERVIVMTKGSMVADGSTFDILRNAEVLAQADLIPPQIIAISEELIKRNPELSHSAIGQANSLSELTRAVEELAARATGSAMAASGAMVASSTIPDVHSNEANQTASEYAGKEGVQ